MGQCSLIIGILTTLLETLNVYECCVCLQFCSFKALQGQDYFLYVLFHQKKIPQKVQRIVKILYFGGCIFTEKIFKEFEQNVNFDHNF